MTHSQPPETTSCILGIDPGKIGGFGLIDAAGHFLLCGNLQTYLDAELPWQIEAAFVEKQWEHSGDTRDNRIYRMGALLQNYGEWRGICMAQKIPIREVAAVTWQGYFGLKFRYKQPGKDRSIKADMVLALARQMFPEAPLGFKNREGWASALLLAEWGRGQLRIERLGGTCA